MSLYALPGLFPPLDCDGMVDDSSTNSRVATSTALSSSMPSSSSSSLAASFVSFLETTTGIRATGTNCGHDEEYKEGCGVNNYDHDNGADDECRYTNGTNGNKQQPDVRVVIKEARIDPARLIQSLTSSMHSKSSTAGTMKQPDRRRPRSTNALSSLAAATDNTDGSVSISPQEESMEFELVVEYRGQCYKAMRNLKSFLLLRQGLASEQQEAAYQHGEALSLTGDCSLSRSSPPLSLSRPSSRPSSSSRIVPEVPRVLGDECGGSVGVGSGGGSALGGCGSGGGVGVTGRGFLFLQAMLKSYVPLLEEWLQNVLQLQQSMMSSSPSLSHFLLWEPTAAAVAVATRRSSSSLASSSFVKLDSIEESDDHEGE